MTEQNTRTWLLTLLFTLGTGTACSGEAAGGASQGGASTAAEGGQNAGTGGASGGTAAGDGSGGSATGSASGGRATSWDGGARSWGGSGGSTNGGSTDGGSTTGGAGSPSAGSAGNAGNAGSGGGATLPACFESARGIAVVLEFPEGMTAPTVSSVPASKGLVYEVEGTLQSVSAVPEVCETCADGEAQRLAMTIVDAEQRVWTLKAGPLERASGWQAAAKAVEGSTVSLMFRYTRGFQFALSTGFVLSDALGPLIVTDQAQYVQALRPADVPGFSVSLGEALCSTPGSDCAKDRYHSLVFSGTTSAEVDLSSDGEFNLGVRTYVARNLGAGVITSNRCIDVEVASPWSVWRSPD